MACSQCKNKKCYKCGGNLPKHLKGGQLSKMGYRDDSPYRNRPYIDIDTPTGKIDMSNTGIPVLANGKYLPPYSGVHQFNTDKVREIPMKKYQYGGYYNPNAQQGYMYQPQQPSMADTSNQAISQAFSAVPGYGQFAVYGGQAQDAFAGPQTPGGAYQDSQKYAISQMFTPHKEVVRQLEDGNYGKAFGALMLPGLGGMFAKQRNEEALAAEKQQPQNLYYNQRPMGYNTYGYRMGGRLPNYQLGGGIAAGLPMIGATGVGATGPLAGTALGAATNIPTAAGIGAGAGIGTGAGIAGGALGAGTTAAGLGAGLAGGSPLAAGHTFGQAGKAVGTAGILGGTALAAATPLAMTNPLGVAGLALGTRGKKNMITSNIDGVNAELNAQIGQPDTPSQYGYQNNTRGYVWGSQSPYGAYGDMPGGSYYGQPQGGYGYMGGSPYYQTGGVGSYPTTYGGGYGGGQSSGNYQPYYGYYQDGGQMTPNAEVQGGEYIFGDKPAVTSGGNIETVAPGLHKVNGKSHSNGGVKVASDGDSYVAGAIDIDSKTLNQIMAENGLKNTFKGFTKQQDVIDALAKDLKKYRDQEYVSEEEVNLVKAKYQKAMDAVNAEAENLRYEKELQQGKVDFKKGGKLPKYNLGDWIDSQQTSNSYNNIGEGNDMTFGYESKDSELLPMEYGTPNSEGFNWGQLAANAPAYLNAAERMYGKYGARNTQDYLKGIYDRGYRLAAPRFNPYGREALGGIQDAQRMTRESLERTTADELLAANRRDRARQANIAGLSRGQQVALGTASDAQRHREGRDISNRYIDKQAALGQQLANLYGAGYNIVGGDTNELRRLDQLNLMSEANWDQTGLMAANARDRYAQGIGQNAFNEYYMQQAYPYLNTGVGEFKYIR